MLTRHLFAEIENTPSTALYGRVTSVLGMLVEVAGIQHMLSVGDRCTLVTESERDVVCEVIGFRNDRAMMMPFTSLDGVGYGCRAYFSDHQPVIFPHHQWMGRVLNGFGQPIDGLGPLAEGDVPCPIKADPINAHARQKVGPAVESGIKAIDTFLTCCVGQRMGIFAGSGVGKTVLLSMLARYVQADVAVIGLIGERGREVKEFIDHELGTEGLERSVIVVATSDESPLMRRQAAYLTMAIAEYFREQKQHVLCMLDSITRFATAQREIGLAVGEPPTTKGYTPTVFTELPKLLERAGPGPEQSGHITGLFTVLVEGDDQNEPIADAVRSILDGHIVLDRMIAERGRFPAINVLKSVSRTIPNCLTADEYQVLLKGRKHLSRFEEMADLIRLGAYKEGSDPEIDQAIYFYPKIESFLKQNKDEYCTMKDGYAELAAILEDG